MNISKKLIGRYVEIVWRDPVIVSVKSYKTDHSDIPTGTDFLAMQKERGVIGDIRDGVVRIEHTEGKDSFLVPDRCDDLQCTFVQEAIIESVMVFVPEAPST